MTRIFLALASAETVALIASFLLGIVSHVRHGSQHGEDSIYLLHFTVGLFTAIGSLLVHCIIFTYFLGTGRWVKEVKLAYLLPDAPLPRLTRELKRRTFPPALAAMLVTIAAAAAGAGAQQQLPQWPWQLHAGLSVAALVVNLWAFRIEFRNIAQNVAVIGSVLEEVDRIRMERGLPTNAEALEKDT
jgi:hypothetical protein